mgnify:FL=1
MKNIIEYSVAGLMAAFCIAGCSDWITPERVTIQTPEKQSPILRDNAYYEALRAYKQTKHKLAFGWYGSWTATGASYQTRLQSAPDSMDIISIWSQWHSLTKEQQEDMRAVQEIKGTKVTYTIFLNNLPDEFKVNGETTDEGIETWAAAYCRDSIAKYGYDGIDIDYEPGYGAVGEFVGHDNEQFKKVILAMSKYVGPKSGTGKLLIIDGVPYAVHKELAEYFDYGIVQAYQSSGYTDLQNRFNQAYAKGWKPEQYIFAENFESYWKNGGVNHRTREGEVVNSLLGMARFNPTQGFAGGFGAYHMEYEYGRSDMPYMYMRKAIQDVNPAGGAMKVTLEGKPFITATALMGDDGHPTDKISSAIKLNFARPLAEDVTFKTSVDNALVAAYNEENETSYKTLDAGLVTLPEISAKKDTTVSYEASIGIDPTSLTEGKYLVPVVIGLPENGVYISAETPLVRYILVNVAEINMNFDASEVTGVKIEPTAEWDFHCYQGTNDSGANGVWNENAQQMFDGSTNAAWYANSASYSWGGGGNFIITMDKAYTVSGFLWYMYYSDANPEIIDFTYSVDGKNWNSLLNGNSFVPKQNSDLYAKVFQFAKPITAKYLRVFVGPLRSGYTSMSEAEVYTPDN